MALFHQTAEDFTKRVRVRRSLSSRNACLACIGHRNRTGSVRGLSPATGAMAWRPTMQESRS
ncbi:MAG: hypothetical protein HZT40_12835 [Candidatus Thiothrix singaporensis]|uniref:Uncharacterized protein n=1 Tax=Candidatus Thiothrix singaporensis TaxID=2799669 RepID=A0A7L6AT68_9GAMM|nr:MAG: hypothetical protein HZT40_12835 [Candidatus Thiothrix singaporensis]